MVGGTVESHNSPITAPNTTAEVGVTGSVMNATTASERAK